MILQSLFLQKMQKTSYPGKKIMDYNYFFNHALYFSEKLIVVLPDFALPLYQTNSNHVRY